MAPLAGCVDHKLTELTPIVSVNPAEVEFADLVLGEPATARVQVGNAGRAPLNVERVVVEPPFSLSWTEGSIRSGDVVAVDLTFTPSEEADIEATLTVISDDLDRPAWDVPVLAQPRAPLIVPDPPELVWEDGLTAGSESLIVSNEGDGPLRILGLAIASDGGGIFSLGLASLPTRMGSGEDAVIDLTALPSELASGTLRILSNDPETPILDVPLQIGATVQECPDLEYPADSVEIDDSCAFAGLPPVWDPVIETAWRAFPTYSASQFCGSVQVGRISDDNGDGTVDAADPPDLVTHCYAEAVTWSGDRPNVVYSAPVIRALSADGSAEHWSVDGFVEHGRRWIPNVGTATAIGDLDQDGLPEVIFSLVDPTNAPAIAAVDHTGALVWLTEISWPDNAVGYPERWQVGPAIADLEGDGDIEVVVGHTILNGTDGSLQGVGPSDSPIGASAVYLIGGPKSVPVDLDGDGRMEVVAGPALLAPDGSTICEASVPDGYPAVADLDLDGDGEVVITGSGEVVLMDHSCQVLDRWDTPDGGNGGPAALADFDADGDVEIGQSSEFFYYVYEVDGTILWQAPIHDESSNSTGSSVFDFDGDGSSEVVFADERDIYVMDGATGRTRFVWTGHSHGTSTEYPVIADVDVDGSAEIVHAHNGIWDPDEFGVTVLGSASSGWMPARPVWNQHAFHMTHVDDELQIPSDTSPNWPALNTFRSADTLGASTDFDRNARPYNRLDIHVALCPTDDG